MKVDETHKEETLKFLFRRWAYANLAIEIKQEEGGRVVADPEERSMQEYAIATVNKRRFINYITRAGFENKGLTIREIVKLVGCSRKAVETMIKELEPLKVIDQGSNESGHNTYKGSSKILKYHLNYTKWLYRVCTNTGIRETAHAINVLENAMDAPDIDHVKLLRA